MSLLEVFASRSVGARLLNHSSAADGEKPSHWNGMRIPNVNFGLRDKNHYF